MILLVDIGNTAVKSAVLAHGRLSPAGAFQHKGADFTALARDTWHEMSTLGKVVVSNVAGPGVGDQFSEWAEEHWHIKPRFVHATDRAFGVTNAYSNPADLGADRWAALVGAHASSSDAACIIDCGTAVTLDFLAASGDHLGGLILPGVAMLEQMLLNSTADIDIANQAGLLRLFATRTEDAVQGGAVYMLVAAIDRIVADMAGVVGTTPAVILTGGDTGRIQPLLASTTHLDPDLVLKGLSIFAGES